MENPFSYGVLFQTPGGEALLWEPDRDLWRAMAAPALQVQLPSEKLLLLKG
jgi:hypothetical protein